MVRHGFQHGSQLLRAVIPADTGRDSEGTDLILHVGPILLRLAELRNRRDAVGQRRQLVNIVLHVPEHERCHHGFSLGERLHDVVFAHVVLVGSLEQVGSLVVNQLLHCIHDLRQLLLRIGVEGQLPRFRVLGNQRYPGGHHVGIHADGVAGDKAVGVVIGALIVAGINVHTLNQVILIVQRPLAPHHDIIQILLLVVIHNRPVIDREEHEAEHGDGNGTRRQELAVGGSKGRQVVIALRPVALARINIVQRGQVLVLALNGRGNCHIGAVDHDVKFRFPAGRLDVGIHLGCDIGAVLCDQGKLDLQLRLDHLVALVHGVRHSTVAQPLADQLVLASGCLCVDDRDLIAAVVQILGQITDQGVIGFGLASCFLRLGTCCLFRTGAAVACPTGGSAEQHQDCQQRAQNLLHILFPFCLSMVCIGELLLSCRLYCTRKRPFCQEDS